MGDSGEIPTTVLIIKQSLQLVIKRQFLLHTAGRVKG
jgi:hypothetical protein